MLPGKGLLNMNIDGSWVDSSSEASIVEIRQDAHGVPVAGLMKKIRADLAKLAETLASSARSTSVFNWRKEARRWEVIYGWRVVTYKWSYKVNSWLVSGRIQSPWTIRLSINECRCLLAHLEGVVVEFCADWIGKAHRIGPSLLIGSLLAAWPKKKTLLLCLLVRIWDRINPIHPDKKSGLQGGKNLDLM